MTRGGPSRDSSLSALLIESVTDYAIFALDVNGNVASWSAGAERIKGYRAEEILGHHFSEFYPPEDLAAGKPERELEIARAEGRVEDEGWRIRKDGTRFWANVVITALRGADGELRGYGKVTRDLTERRGVEQALRESEERFRLLVESVIDYAIYLLDRDGRVSTWNLGAQRMKGYAADEIVGQSFSRFFPEEDIRAGKPERELGIARAEGRFEDEGWRVRKDGTRFWANVVLTALRDSTGQLVGYVKITRDLTARRQAEEIERKALAERAAREVAQQHASEMRRSAESAEEAARRAEEANRLKDDFLATVSHELRTPLNAILGYASLLRGRSADVAATAKGLDVIHRNALAQARIIDDILDVSRIITGKVKLDVRATNLAGVVQDAVEVIRPSALAKRIAVDFDVRTPTTVVAADPERLRQVVWNLLSNAVKFTDAGGTIAIALEREGESVVIDVRDTGRGIDPAFLPYVFDRFRQADSSTTRRIGGLGLGLAIVRHIVELHGGHAEAHSAGLGKGAVFRIVLPIRAVAPERTTEEGVAERVRPAVQVQELRSLAGIRVLLVDDDPDARDVLREVLVQAGATVETAASAAEGFDVLGVFQPHVLVSDIGMPDEDGFTLMERIRAREAPGAVVVPSIALTAYTRSQDRVRAIEAGFTTHISKPVDADHLVAVVANLAAPP